MIQSRINIHSNYVQRFTMRSKIQIVCPRQCHF